MKDNLFAQVHGHVLTALANTLKLDLAAAPLLIAREAGIGLHKLLTGLCHGLGFDYVDFHSHSEIADVIELMKTFEGGMIKIDVENPDLAEILEAITEYSTADSVVCIVSGLATNDQDRALSAIEQHLKVHRAHVPTARLSVDNTVKQPVLLVSEVWDNGAKRGERYFTASSELGEEIHLKVMGFPHQSDDDLNEALENLFDSRRRQVALRLEWDDEGSLELAQNAYEVL